MIAFAAAGLVIAEDAERAVDRDQVAGQLQACCGTGRLDVALGFIRIPGSICLRSGAVGFSLDLDFVNDQIPGPEMDTDHRRKALLLPFLLTLQDLQIAVVRIADQLFIGKALFAGSATGPLAGLTIWFRRESSSAYRRSRETIAQVIVHFVETFGGIRAVQAFRREHRNKEIFGELNTRYAEASLRSSRLIAVYSPSITLVGNLATGAVLLYGGLRVMDGDIKVGVLATFLLYLERFFARGALRTPPPTRRRLAIRPPSCAPPRINWRSRPGGDGSGERSLRYRFLS